MYSDDDDVTSGPFNGHEANVRRQFAEVEPVTAAVRAANRPGLDALGVEAFMVVLRPWLGIHDDVELERACQRIRSDFAALPAPNPFAAEGPTRLRRPERRDVTQARNAF